MSLSVSVCSSPALAVGVSVIISTSVAMETISVTLIGFITRRVGLCRTGRGMEKKTEGSMRGRVKRTEELKVRGHEKSVWGEKWKSSNI